MHYIMILLKAVIKEKKTNQFRIRRPELELLIDI